MKNILNAITAILIILFFGWLTLDNCCSKEKPCVKDCTKECCDIQCGENCTKACCLGCKSTEGDAKCLEDGSCCADKEVILDTAINISDSSQVINDTTSNDTTSSEENNIEEELDNIEDDK